MGRTVAVALFGLLFGAVVVVLVPSHAGRDGYAALANIQSPAFFPLVLAICLLATSFVVLLSGWLERNRPPADIAAEEAPDPSEQRIEAPWRLLLTMALIVGYYVALSWLGMLPASIGLILLLGLVLGFRNYLFLVLVAVTLPLGIYFLFRRLLYVLLPEGRLF